MSSVIDMFEIGQGMTEPAMVLGMSSDVVEDLTSKTVTLRMTPSTGGETITRTMEIVSIPERIVRYKFTTTDTAKPLTFKAQIVINNGDNSYLRMYPIGRGSPGYFYIKVVPKL